MPVSRPLRRLIIMYGASFLTLPRTEASGMATCRTANPNWLLMLLVMFSGPLLQHHKSRMASHNTTTAELLVQLDAFPL